MRLGTESQRWLRKEINHWMWRVSRGSGGGGEGLRDQASGLGICWTGKAVQAPGRRVRGSERLKEVWHIDSEVPVEHLSKNAFYYVLKPHFTPRLWKAEFTQNFPQGGTSLGTGTECANRPYPSSPEHWGRWLSVAKNQMTFLVCCMKITYATNTWCWKMPSRRVSQEQNASETTSTRFKS